MSGAAAAAWGPAHGAGFSSDRFWYWDGRRWQSTVSADGRWWWDGARWNPVSSARPKAVPASRRLRVSTLLGLLALDVAGFVPGVSFVTSAVAAGVLLTVDPRGLVTLNGLIRWHRMDFRRKLLVAGLEVVLFQFLVLGYLVQRLLERATDAMRRPNVSQSNVVPVPEWNVVPSLDSGDVEPALDALLAQADAELPRDLRAKVRMVVKAVRDVLPAYRAGDLAAHDRFVVERTARDYLPSAVGNYLRLPSAYRLVPLPEADGKSAAEVLAEELDLLLRRLRQVVDAAYRKDVEAILVHRRFLRSKFGRSSLTIDES